MSDVTNYAEDDGFSLVSLAHGLLIALLALKGRSLQLGRRHGRRTFALSQMSQTLDFKHLERTLESLVLRETGMPAVLARVKAMTPHF